TTNNSKVIDMGGIPEFNALGGRIIEGQPVPVNYDRRVANPDGVDGTWEYVDGGEDQIIGPQLPTHFITPSLSLRTPGNIQITARGEYRGGNMMEVNPIAVERSVRSPLCAPYYEQWENPVLKADTPNIWRERCSASGGYDYWMDADYFKLRTVSATIPVGFAFPDRVSNATLTLALNNIWDWYREIPWYDAEIPSNNGATEDAIGNATERLPGPATFRISLRVTF